MRRALYAGSFDPYTNGHLWVTTEGAKVYDELILALAVNPDKRYTFTEAERLEMLRESTHHLPNVRVVSCSNELLANFAKEVRADFLLRGIRSSSDYEQERGARHMNSHLNPDLSTFFVMPPPSLTEISSSFVKGLVSANHWENVVREFVPKPVFRLMLEKFELKRWAGLCQRLGATDQSKIQQTYNQVVYEYAKPKRFYHNMVHILDCLLELEALHSGYQYATLEMALWLHDVIYDAERNDNEELSADFAIRVARDLGIDPVQAEEVGRLILHTKTHQGSSSIVDQLMSDIDLSILGKDEEIFDEYEKEIRQEYLWVPIEVFNEKRAEILRSFLTRDRIFFTDVIGQKYEKQAQLNLERSLQKLES